MSYSDQTRVLLEDVQVSLKHIVHGIMDPIYVSSIILPGTTKGRGISVPFTSCLTGLESSVWQLTKFVFICKTDKSKPIKQEVNSTVILPPLVFPGIELLDSCCSAGQRIDLKNCDRIIDIKRQIDCPRFVMCPLLAPVFQGFFCCSH